MPIRDLANNRKGSIRHYPSSSRMISLRLMLSIDKSGHVQYLIISSAHTRCRAVFNWRANRLWGIFLTREVLIDNRVCSRKCLLLRNSRNLIGMSA
jgi:hypothetical protein